MSKKMNEALRVMANHGRILLEAAEDPLMLDHPSEIDSPEDIWASGESIALELDHANVTHGADEQVTEPETLEITELKRLIKRMLREQGYASGAGYGSSGLADEELSGYTEEVILDYEKIASDELDYVIGQLQQGGLSIRPGGVEVFEEKPGLVSIAVSDEHMLEAVIDILGEPLAER